MVGDSPAETQEGGLAVSAEKSDAFAWRIRLSDKEPAKRWGVAACAVLALVAGTLLFSGPLLGVVGFVIILAATAEFWLGVSYRTDAKGASARCGLSVTAMEWVEVKRAAITPDGVRLSPLATPSKLEPFRGMLLRFDSATRDSVIAFVQRNLPDHVQLLGG